jgi:hypothetical protein
MMGGDHGERTEAIWPRGQEAKEDGAKEAERRQCWVDLCATTGRDDEAPFQEGLIAGQGGVSQRDAKTPA